MFCRENSPLVCIAFKIESFCMLRKQISKMFISKEMVELRGILYFAKRNQTKLNGAKQNGTKKNENL